MKGCAHKSRSAILFTSPGAPGEGWVGVRETGDRLSRDRTWRIPPPLSSPGVPGEEERGRAANNIGAAATKVGWILSSVLLLPWIVSAPAMAGTVRTFSGETFSGTVTISPDNQLVINQPDIGFKRVDPTNVLEATFSQEPQPPPLRQGVVLTDGAAIAATIVRADQSTLVYERDNVQSSVPIARVARIILDPAAAGLLADIPQGQSGVLLASGDFVQGDLTSLSGQDAQITSVLFGINTYAVGKQAVAVILAPVEEAPCNWVVNLADGSVIMASSLRFDEGELIATDLTQGTFMASAFGLYSYRVGPARVTPLAGLPAAAPPGAWQRLASVALRGGYSGPAIEMPAGASVVYDLGKRYSVFTCQIAVPPELTPSASVDFVVLGDGAELARAPSRTSVDDPIQIAVPLAGVKDLVLEVRSSVPADLGAYGLWAQAELVRAGRR